MLDAVRDFLLLPYDAISDMVDGGGPFVGWILVCGVVMWTLVVERIWYFSRILPREVEETLAEWNARGDRYSWCARQIRRAMISRLNAGMTANFPLLRVLVPLAPLLGLIGTVSGMLEVFESMALRGSADARAMATGVSHAMICTLSGLAVSITGLYPVYHFASRARRETEAVADRLAV